MEKIEKGPRIFNDLFDVYKTFHITTAAYTFFSSAHGTFTKIDNILGQKTSLNKFKRIQIIQLMFSVHNGINLEIYERKITKYLKMM